MAKVQHQGAAAWIMAPRRKTISREEADRIDMHRRFD
jgi:hypothetical protein